MSGWIRCIACHMQALATRAGFMCVHCGETLPFPVGDAYATGVADKVRRYLGCTDLSDVPDALKAALAERDDAGVHQRVLTAQRDEAEAEAARSLDAIIEVGEALGCAVGATPTEILARAKRYAGIVDAAKELVFCDYLTECESYNETAPGSHQAAACRAGDAQGVLSRLIDELQESETNPTTTEAP